MSEESSRLAWSDEQWATVQQVVQNAARLARVASSFLPLHGPLAPGQATVPALSMTSPELLDRQRGEAQERLVIDEGATLRLTTIACDVYLTTQQAQDPDLAVARDLLGRAADVTGRLEDAIVFNGQPGVDSAPLKADGAPVVVPPIYTVRNAGPNPGLLTPFGIGGPEGPTKTVSWGKGDEGGQALVEAIVGAIQELEGRGHYGPFACVLGRTLYLVANTPNRGSLVLPSDRIIPFLSGPLLRSSTVPDDQGVVVALAAAPIDLVVGTDVHASFVQLSVEPRYVLRVSERFVLRMKQPDAVCQLRLQP